MQQMDLSTPKVWARSGWEVLGNEALGGDLFRVPRPRRVGACEGPPMQAPSGGQAKLIGGDDSKDD